jgi:fibronectin type 3 domain-containing protein
MIHSPVKLRITFEREQKYYSIKGQSYTKSDYEKIIAPKPRGVYKVAKRKLDSIENRAITIIDENLSEFSFEDFENLYKNKKKKKNTIQDFFETKIKELKKESKFQSAILYRAALKSLNEFAKKLTDFQ